MTEDTRSAPDAAPSEPTDLKFIGPATAEIMAEAGHGVEAVLEKRISYRMLVEAGANPGVATKIRREHSLPWTITEESGEDLSKRSDQVRGLRDGERAWVAASAGDWTEAEPETGDDSSTQADVGGGAEVNVGSGADGGSGAEADGGGGARAAEAAWRDRSKPTPVTDLEEVTESDAKLLAKIGVSSIRSLATVSPDHVADVLGIDEKTVRVWREAAAERS